MELHKTLINKKYNISLNDNYLDYFSKAKEFVLDNYSDEYNRIANTKFDDITPEFFFREYIWCVYTSGFNSKIVSRLFPALQKALGPLVDVFKTFKTDINTLDVATNALNIINNKRKVKSIIKMAFEGGKEINNIGWSIYKEKRLNSPDKLKELPFIGKITAFHLARNAGQLNYVKPDIHLTRLAKNWNFDNPDILCREIQKHYDIPVGLIDLILFYAASTFGSR
jgi:hypothetical protein